MSSTPLLDRTSDATIEWVEVVSPQKVDRSPRTSDLIITLGKIRSSIQAGAVDSITINTDSFDAIDEDDVIAGTYAAEAWDE